MLATLGLLLGFEVFAGLLIDHLHRQPDFAALVEAQKLDLHLVAFLDDVGGLLHAAWSELADVNESVFGAEEVHEGAEVHDLDDGAIVDVSDFGLGSDRLDPVDRRLDGVGFRRGDLDRAVVLDIDLGPGFFHDLADHLAARTDHLADLVDRDLHHFDPRRMLAKFRARRRQRLAHLDEDVQAAVFGLSQRDAHDLFSDARDLDIHLQRRDAAVGAGDLEVHVAKMVLVAEDVGEHREALVFEDKSHGNARGRALERHAGIHQRQ